MDNRFKQYKALISDIYDIDTGMVIEPSGKYSLLKEDKERLKIAYQFLKLIKDTSFVTLETKLCLLDPRSTSSSVAHKVKTEYNMEVSEKNIYQIWYRDRLKIISLVGESFMNDLVSYRDRDISGYSEKLLNEISKYSVNNFRDKCILNLDSRYMRYDLSDEDFNAFVNKIRPYFNRVIKEVQESLDKEALAYFKYLTSHEQLNALDMDRLERLNRLAVGGDSQSIDERISQISKGDSKFGTESDKSLEALGVE